MKIGLEAKRVFQNKTGLGNATRCIVKALATNYPQHQYHLYAPKITPLFTTASFSNIYSQSPINFFNKFFKSFWRSKGIVPQLVSNNIDIYIGLGAELPLGIKSSKIPSIVIIYDLIFERYPQQYNPIDVVIHRIKMKYACKTADKILTISVQTKQDLIDFYKVPASKIEVIYLSCDEHFYTRHSKNELQNVKQKYDLPDAYFLSVGSIIERKGLLKICEAMVAMQHKTVPLVVIGNGKNEYKNLITEFIAKYNLHHKIIFLNEHPQAQLSDYKTSKDFPAIYQGALALIYPSIFEGFGLPILEGMASGIPVITSLASCMPEVGGDAVLYINPLDNNSIAKAMDNIITDADLRTVLIEKGKLQATIFSEKLLADRIMTVVNDVMKK